MLESLRNKRILVVVAHPDDEVLGLGGTIHKLVTEYKCVIRTIILGEGITSRSEERDAKKWSAELKQHRKNIQSSIKAVGYASVGIYDFPDNRFDAVNVLDLVKVIEKEKEEFKPTVIFTHHGGDTNIDHQLTFQAVVTGCRPMAHEMVKTIITFETPSSTEWQAFNHPLPFHPNMYVGLKKKNVDAKIKAMESYDFEKRPFPHPRSPEALSILAQKRGVEVGEHYAEAFVIIRSIN